VGVEALRASVPSSIPTLKQSSKASLVHVDFRVVFREGFINLIPKKRLLPYLCPHLTQLLSNRVPRLLSEPNYPTQEACHILDCRILVFVNICHILCHCGDVLPEAVLVQLRCKAGQNLAVLIHYFGVQIVVLTKESTGGLPFLDRIENLGLERCEVLPWLRKHLVALRLDRVL
jgi:hypothetical protein